MDKIFKIKIKRILKVKWIIGCMVLSVIILFATRCEAGEAPIVVWAETLEDVIKAVAEVFDAKMAELEKESDAELAKYIEESIKHTSEVKTKYRDMITAENIKALDADLAKQITTMTEAHKKTIDRYEEMFMADFQAIDSLITTRMDEKHEALKKSVERQVKAAEALKDGKGFEEYERILKGNE